MLSKNKLFIEAFKNFLLQHHCIESFHSEISENAFIGDRMQMKAMIELS